MADKPGRCPNTSSQQAGGSNLVLGSSFAAAWLLGIQELDLVGDEIIAENRGAVFFVFGAFNSSLNINMRAAPEELNGILAESAKSLYAEEVGFFPLVPVMAGPFIVLGKRELCPVRVTLSMSLRITSKIADKSKIVHTHTLAAKFFTTENRKPSARVLQPNSLYQYPATFVRIGDDKD